MTWHKLTAGFISAILVALVSRLIPHPPNLTGIISLSLFAGYFVNNPWLSIVGVIFTMLISDSILGFHNLMPVVYGTLILCVFVPKIIGDGFIRKYLVSPIVASLLFFIITNFFVWLGSGIYSHNLKGLIQCYVAAIPFGLNTLLGTLIYLPLYEMIALVIEKQVIRKLFVSMKQ